MRPREANSRALKERTGARARSSMRADGVLCVAASRNTSPSHRYIFPKLAAQIWVAFARIDWNTGSSTPGELEMTRSTSEVAVCCSSASSSCFRVSASSRVRAPTCSCRSATVDLPRRVAVGALLRLGLVVLPCCAFLGLRLIVRLPSRRALPWAADHVTTS